VGDPTAFAALLEKSTGEQPVTSEATRVEIILTTDNLIRFFIPLGRANPMPTVLCLISIGYKCAKTRFAE